MYLLNCTPPLWVEEEGKLSSIWHKKFLHFINASTTGVRVASDQESRTKRSIDGVLPALAGHFDHQ